MNQCVLCSCGSLPKLAAVCACGVNVIASVERSDIVDSPYAAICLYGPHSIASIWEVLVHGSVLAVLPPSSQCISVCFMSTGWQEGEGQLK